MSLTSIPSDTNLPHGCVLIYTFSPANELAKSHLNNQRLSPIF